MALQFGEITQERLHYYYYYYIDLWLETKCFNVFKTESFFSETDWTRSRGAIVSVSSDGAADTPHLKKRDVSKRNLPDTWL